MSKTERPLISQGLEDFLKYVRNTAQDYRIALADEQQANNETQDILHAIELQTGNWKPAQLLRKLRNVRARRRIAKDTIAAAEPVAIWYDKNQATVKELERLLGEVRKQERKTQNRAYVPRTNVLEEANGGNEQKKG